VNATGDRHSSFAADWQAESLQNITNDNTGIFEGNHGCAAGCAEDGVWQNRSGGLGERFDDVQISAHGLFA
jgi:hypothetical protein